MNQRDPAADLSPKTSLMMTAPPVLPRETAAIAAPPDLSRETAAKPPRLTPPPAAAPAPPHVPADMPRRTALTLLACLALLPAPVAAAPSRAIIKRIEAWRRGGAAGLTARYRCTRRTSMLWDPLVVHGTLVFTAPDRLELRDDEPTGATTRLAGGVLTIDANDPALPPAPTPPPATAWLHDHLLALFAARDADALQQGARLSVPRGPGLQLLLSPERGHPAEAVVEHLRVRLDPDTGALLELEWAHPEGDRVTLELSDHRPAPV